jgi:alcohol dehydrogenase (cytochrome c)
VPGYDATYRPGDNLYTNSVISWDPDSGKMNWYFQYTPCDHWDYDEAGTHILVDGQVAGQSRKMTTHSARNGFLYTRERNNGQTLLARPYINNINWTKGIDQKTGKPVDYDTGTDIQLYSGTAAPTLDSPTKKMCPGPSGGNNFWPSTYSVKTHLIYIPTATPCVVVTQNPALSNKASDWKGGTYKQTERFESELTVADPFTGEVKKSVHIPYPNYSGTLSTAGGLVFTGFTDGTFAAYDDTTLDQVWKINVGTGFNAPPMTFEAGGKQYVAILAGLSPIARSKHQLIPELKDQRNQTMLFVFGL